MKNWKKSKQFLRKKNAKPHNPKSKQEKTRQNKRNNTTTVNVSTIINKFNKRNREHLFNNIQEDYLHHVTSDKMNSLQDIELEEPNKIIGTLCVCMVRYRSCYNKENSENKKPNPCTNSTTSIDDFVEIQQSTDNNEKSFDIIYERPKYTFRNVCDRHHMSKNIENRFMRLEYKRVLYCDKSCSFRNSSHVKSLLPLNIYMYYDTHTLQTFITDENTSKLLQTSMVDNMNFCMIYFIRSSTKVNTHNAIDEHKTINCKYLIVCNAIKYFTQFILKRSNSVELKLGLMCNSIKCY